MVFSPARGAAQQPLVGIPPQPQPPSAGFRTKVEHLIDIITRSREEPLDYGEVAKEVYGVDNEDSRGRLRSALSSLSHTNRIISAGRNRWRLA